jgi:hypothetical protein
MTEKFDPMKNFRTWLKTAHSEEIQRERDKHKFEMLMNPDWSSAPMQLASECEAELKLRSEKKL